MPSMPLLSSINGRVKWWNCDSLAVLVWKRRLKCLRFPPTRSCATGNSPRFGSCGTFENHKYQLAEGAKCLAPFLRFDFLRLVARTLQSRVRGFSHGSGGRLPIFVFAGGTA